MSRLSYEEIQRFSNLRWLWLVVAIICLAPVIIGSLSEIKSEEQVYITILSVCASSIPLGLLMLFGKFEIKVSDDGLQYRFYPGTFKWVMIDSERLESIEVRQKKGLYEHLTCGYKRHLLRKTIVMNIHGEKFVIVKLIDGKKLKIGSVNADELGNALQKLKTATNNL